MLFSSLSTGTQRRAKSPQLWRAWGADGLSLPRQPAKIIGSVDGGFFQVNRFLIDEFVRLSPTGRHGAIAWDLYAGVGLFSRALAGAFQQVVAVEAAANDLSRLFKGAGRRAVQSTTLDFLRSAVVQRDRPELIVMDPPRAGVGAEVCALLATSRRTRDRLRLLRSRHPGKRPENACRCRLQNR